MSSGKPLSVPKTITKPIRPETELETKIDDLITSIHLLNAKAASIEKTYKDMLLTIQVLLNGNEATESGGEGEGRLAWTEDELDKSFVAFRGGEKTGDIVRKTFEFRSHGPHKTGLWVVKGSIKDKNVKAWIDWNSSKIDKKEEKKGNQSSSEDE